MQGSPGINMSIVFALPFSYRGAFLRAAPIPESVEKESKKTGARAVFVRT
jgi:hypothetical protein